MANNNICRVCLITGKFNNLFELNVVLSDGLMFPFNEILSFCCSFKITRTIEQYICEKCVHACTNAYNFIKLFQKNNAIFEKLLQANSTSQMRDGEMLAVMEPKIEIVDDHFNLENTENNPVLIVPSNTANNVPNYVTNVVKNSFDPATNNKNKAVSEVKIEVVDDYLSIENMGQDCLLIEDSNNVGKPQKSSEISTPSTSLLSSLLLDKNTVYDAETGTKAKKSYIEKHDCPLCSLIFTSFTEFNQHLKGHPDIKKCHLCQVDCKNTDDFSQHYYENHYNYCFICDKSFLNRKRYFYHRDVNHPYLVKYKMRNKPASNEQHTMHTCPLCPKKHFSEYMDLADHMMDRHYSAKIEICNVCTHKCSSADEFLRHYFQRHYVYCSICDRSFLTCTKFQKHNEKKHPLLATTANEKQIERVEKVEKDKEVDLKSNFDVSKKHFCPLCTKFYVLYPEFVEHVNSHGAAIKTCHICNVDCENNDRFHQHYYHAHYIYCSPCKLSFKNRSEYRTHKASCKFADLPSSSMENTKTINESVKNCKKAAKSDRIRCPVCYRMVQVQFFKEHELNHKQSPKYKCDKCDAVFLSSDRLYHHRSTKHNLLKHFLCQKCGQKFGTRNKLRYHLAACQPRRKVQYSC